MLAPAISEESCVIVGLFHDAGNWGCLGKPLYLPNDNEWLAKNRGIRYKINPNVVAMGLAVRSLYLVTQYISLSDAEAQPLPITMDSILMTTKSWPTKRNPDPSPSLGRLLDRPYL